MFKGSIPLVLTVGLHTDSLVFFLLKTTNKSENVGHFTPLVQLGPWCPRLGVNPKSWLHILMFPRKTPVGQLDAHENHHTLCLVNCPHFPEPTTKNPWLYNGLENEYNHYYWYEPSINCCSLPSFSWLLDPFFSLSLSLSPQSSAGDGQLFSHSSFKWLPMIFPLKYHISTDN